MSEQEINDLIFKELLKRGYSLNSGTRIWNIGDSKLWYLTPEQAQAYLDLDNDKSYKNFTGQDSWKNLVKQNINELVEEIDGQAVNIVDLGCGNGSKAAFVIQELSKVCTNLKLRYCPIDISGHMVMKAIETFSKLNLAEIVDFQWNISDFENLENITPLLKSGDYKKNIIFFFGNTLDNFEIHEMLYALRIAMDDNDLLVIDTAINDHRQDERINSYVNSPFYKGWLIHVPLLLGLKDSEIDFNGRFKNSRIEMFFTLKNDKEIKFQDKVIKLKEGDQIVVAVLYKYEKEILKSYLNMHFSNVSASFSDDNSKILAFCKK